MHTYEVRPSKDKRGVDLISDALPFGSATDHRFQFHKCGQLFIRVHNETLSVIAMCVSNPDCSPFGING
jgi:hypothetical protein